MRTVLFASDKIGVKIAKFLNYKNNPPVALVLDEGDRNGYNNSIIDISGVDKSLVIYNSKLEEYKTIELLKSLQLDMGILVWWPNIVRKIIFDIPKRGIINFHPSFLPYNRGKDPYFWSIVDETMYGVTIHSIDEDIDTGGILVQELIKVDWEDTSKSLYRKSREKLVTLFKKYYDDIVSGRITPTPQNLRAGSYHCRKDLEESSRIDFNKKYYAVDLLNLLRAKTFYPHPAAWFEDDDKKYEVHIEIKQVGK